MKLWGLTGGIASGKSTVHKMLVSMGAHVVDADAVYHGLVAPVGDKPSALTQAIAAQFSGVVRPDGALDRRALGSMVFADAAARKRLEAITHPAVASAVQKRVAQWSVQGVPHAVYDVPLLFERNMQDKFAGIIVVWVPLAMQIMRLKQRDNLDDTAALLRLGAQLPLDDKRIAARWTIDNSGSLQKTQAQTELIWQQICALPKEDSAAP
ncbi:hypothetical protein Q3G72_015368 [Acer saccharum]|nr:hypothetical protein Q3G72_015368 [Acer saccharum]